MMTTMTSLRNVSGLRKRKFLGRVSNLCPNPRSSSVYETKSLPQIHPQHSNIRKRGGLILDSACHSHSHQSSSSHHQISCASTFISQGLGLKFGVLGGVKLRRWKKLHNLSKIPGEVYADAHRPCQKGHRKKPNRTLTLSRTFLALQRVRGESKSSGVHPLPRLRKWSSIAVHSRRGPPSASLKDRKDRVDLPSKSIVTESQVNHHMATDLTISEISHPSKTNVNRVNCCNCKCRGRSNSRQISLLSIILYILFMSLAYAYFFYFSNN